MKHHADQHRSEREFAVRDLVYLKLQLYIQSTVAPRANAKLSFRFYGPFNVLARVGNVAYRLELPPQCRIHPVVHVSQLKQHVPPSATLEPDITDVPVDFADTVSLVQFQTTQVIQKGATSLAQIQVRCSGCSPTLLTWEEVHDLRRKSPDSPAWGQAGFQAGRNVRIRKGNTAQVAIGRPATGGEALKKS